MNNNICHTLKVKVIRMNRDDEKQAKLVFSKRNCHQMDFIRGNNKWTTKLAPTGYIRQ